MTPLIQEWPAPFAERYRAAGYWRGDTFPTLLRAWAAAHGDRPAVVDSRHRWTYGDLLRQAEAVAGGLLARGLAPGDRVVVQLPNRAEFLSVVFGLFLARMIPVYALPAHRQVEITHFARVAEAVGYITVDHHDGFDHRTIARAAREAVPALRTVIILGDAQEFQPLDERPTDPPPALPEDPPASAVAFLQISGGTTGLSKLIPRTHDDYIYSVRASAEICGLSPATRYLAVLPVAHNFPMSSPGILGVLHAGGTVVMSPSPSPDVAFPLIEHERVTLTSLVPPLALVWLQAVARTSHDLSSLQLLQIGGAKLTPEVARRISPAFRCALQQVFGMAEGLVNYTRLGDPGERVVTTQGRPISPDDEIRIVDEDGQPVPEGAPGHLETRGPYTIRAYHNDPAANARAFTADGFYRTGDIVRRTAEGDLVVQGRATDHINRAGEKVSAEEVEDHLIAHARVFDAAVVSIPDPFLGERACAFIIPIGPPPRPGVLKAWIRDRGVAAYKVPDQIVFVDSFETSAVGKTSRKSLREALRRRLLEETRPGAKAPQTVGG